MTKCWVLRNGEGEIVGISAGGSPYYALTDAWEDEVTPARSALEQQLERHRDLGYPVRFTVPGYSLAQESIPSTQWCNAVRLLETPELTDLLLTTDHPVFGVECTATLGDEYETIVGMESRADAIVEAIYAVKKRVAP